MPDLQKDAWVLIREGANREGPFFWLGQITKIKKDTLATFLILEHIPEYLSWENTKYNYSFVRLPDEVLPVVQIPFEELGIYLSQLKPLSAKKLAQLSLETS